MIENCHQAPTSQSPFSEDPGAVYPAETHVRFVASLYAPRWLLIYVDVGKSGSWGKDQISYTARRTPVDPMQHTCRVTCDLCVLSIDLVYSHIVDQKLGRECESRRIKIGQNRLRESQAECKVLERKRPVRIEFF